MRAQFVFSEMWIGLRRNLTMTIALIVTVAISLALFGLGLMVRSQMAAMKDYWYDKIEVSVFLCVSSSNSEHCENNGAATKEQKAQIRDDLRAMPQVRKVHYENQAKAWQRFKEEFSESPLLESTEKKDMPDSFRVALHDPRKYQVVASAVQGRPGVDSVATEQAVLQPFFDMLNTLRNAAWFVCVVLVVAAGMLISNTIRLAAYNRRRETGIMRLVGASNFYIQLPFLLEGVIAGLIGGVFAAGSMTLVKQFFITSIAESFPLFAYIGWPAVIRIVMLQLVVGVLLCGLLSFITLRKYLRV